MASSTGKLLLFVSILIKVIGCACALCFLVKERDLETFDLGIEELLFFELAGEADPKLSAELKRPSLVDLPFIVSSMISFSPNYSCSLFLTSFSLLFRASSVIWPECFCCENFYF